MKKILLSGIIVIGFVFYAIFRNNSLSAVPVSSNKNGLSASTISTGSSQGSYKDGAYTGSATDAFYGTIQVKAAIQNGKITDVQFLQYPNSQEESVQVSNSSMPVLKQEAIAAQNANVAIVSGATQTSQAFKESLASALSQAK